MSVKSYSRSAIISLMKESLSQLRELSGQFIPCEIVDSFTIRLKMMENLARLAFNYSIKVSYLNESAEYAHIAEMLDDVILQIRRAGVCYAASTYGFLVTREYEAMQDALDLLDERLKTIRVVCFNRRDRKVSRNSKYGSEDEELSETRYSYRKDKTPYKVECGCCYVDKNGYRKRELYPCELPNVNDSEPAYKIGRREQKLRDYIGIDDSDNESMIKQFNIINAKNTVPTQKVPSAKTIEEIEADKKFVEFAKVVKAHLNKFYSYTNEPNAEVRLSSQCNEITIMFKLIMDNIDYISSDPRFRKYRKNGEYSIMQVYISKCVQLYTEISAKYDLIRRNSKRANPALRSAKIEAMDTIEKAEHILCKYYTEKPVEKETVEYLMSNPRKQT